MVGSVDPQSAESLVVRTAWRRRNIPVDAVNAVVPAARLIVVDDGADEVAQAPSHHRTRVLAEASSHAASAVAATVTDKAPPLARFVRDVVLVLALFAAAALVRLVRAARLLAVHAAQQAAVAVARLTAPRAGQARPRRPQ